MKCEKCGNIIEDKYIWCPVCGTKKPKGVIVNNTASSTQVDNKSQENENISISCGKCGKKIKLGCNFCNNCGNKLIGENISSYNESLVVYCECGQKLESGWKFCSNCQRPITVEIRNEKKSVNEKQNDANIYLLIYAISVGVYMFGGLIPFVSYSSSLCGLVALVTIITGKIKCPNSVIIKVLFWITIVYIICLFILMLWMIVVCNDMLDSLQSCPG